MLIFALLLRKGRKNIYKKYINKKVCFKIYLVYEEVYISCATMRNVGAFCC